MVAKAINPGTRWYGEIINLKIIMCEGLKLVIA